MSIEWRNVVELPKPKIEEVAQIDGFTVKVFERDTGLDTFFHWSVEGTNVHLTGKVAMGGGSSAKAHETARKWAERMLDVVREGLPDGL